MARPSKQDQARRIQEKKAALNKSVEEKQEAVTGSEENYEGMGFGKEENASPKKETIKNEPSQPITDPFLSAKTTEKPYATDNVHIQGHIPSSVPEDVIEIPTVDLRIDAGAQQKTFEPGEVKNPHWDDMTKKQQTSGSEFIAENVINGYEALNELAKNYVSFDEQKYIKKAIKGEFDMDALDIELPISEDGSQTIHIRKFLNDTNESAEKIFEVSDKFKDQVRPLLTQIFKDKGWGLSPTTQLLYLVGKDALPKTVAVFQIKEMQKQFLDVALQVLSKYREIAEAQRNSQMAQPGVTINKEPVMSEPEQTVEDQKSVDTIESNESVSNGTVVVDNDNYADLANARNEALNIEQSHSTNKKGKPAKKGKANLKNSEHPDAISEGKEPGEK